MKRLLISGTNSNCGKTTITCAILAALNNRKVSATAFKCGPDYIDPMFHRAVLGTPSYNLDPFFLDGEGLRSHFSAHTNDLAIIEGAMGYYDGIASSDKASAYTVAKETQTPVILVISSKGAGASLGAVIEGFVRYKTNSYIVGVIFNDTNESRYADLKKIANRAGVKPYGYMPRKEEWSIESRNLGLLTADEVTNIQDILTELGKQAEQTIDIDNLLLLAGTAPALAEVPKFKNRIFRDVRLAVAKDDAFCFLYEENLKMLESLGCELVFFSPLHDTVMPDNIQGLYLCGGYPELYASKLSENTAMLKQIKAIVDDSLPTIAEGGGFMYLHDTLDGLPMCGVVHEQACKTKSIKQFGYIKLTAKCDNLICKKGESFPSREFHYSDSTNIGEDFLVKKAGRKLSYTSVHATDSLFAGFPCLFFPANPALAIRFVERMASYER